MIGLKLLLTQKYLLGIFGISTIYEVVGTIMDYQMKMLAKETYPTTEAYTSFLASFGVAVNTVSFSIALLGTSFLLRRFGLRICLLIFPCAVLAVLTSVLVYPVLSVVFGAQVILKGLSYAINNPSKEMLYIPTGPDVKFKVKSWIDMFGGRSAKAVGAATVNQVKDTLEGLLRYGTLIGYVWVGVWIFIALFVGRTWAALTLEKEALAAENTKPKSVDDLPTKPSAITPGAEEEQQQ